MALLRSLAIAPAKLVVLQKETVARGLSRIVPVYLVNEYPKSGGTWLKYMLAEAMGLPAWTQGRPASGSCVMQMHSMRRRGDCRTVALFRDGRDVMVSYYHHSFYINDQDNSNLVGYMRGRFQFNDYSDVRSNMLPFMKVMMEKPISPAFSWVDFVREWADRSNVVGCRYEDLRADTAGELARLVEALSGKPLSRDRARRVAEAYTVENMRRRLPELNPRRRPRQDAEISFVRKGAVGGWSQYFTDEALDWFQARAGGELRILGYPLDRPSTQ